MKLRGVVTDHSALNEFYNIALTLSKLSKECILRITKTSLYFVMMDETTGINSPVVWCQLNTNYLFREYTMDGLSPEHNEIFLAFAPAMLITALRFLKQCAKSMKIKLTSKSTPCLTIEIECPQGNQNQQCMHDIPVKIIPQKMWHEFVEPADLNFDIIIAMPPLKWVKNISERLKSLSQHIIISASNDGRFSMSIKTTAGDIATHYTNLEVEGNGGLTQMDNEDTCFSSRIDIKKFHSYFANQQITNRKTLCGIIQDKLIRVFIENDYVKAQFFMPAVSD